MLKTHLKPIVSYLFNAGHESVNSTSDQATQEKHLQPMINYFVEVDLPDHREQPKRPQPATYLSQLWHALTTVDTDPKVKQRFDRSGQPYWQVYDPIADKHYSFGEEEEVYQWLERRYYQ